MLTPQPCVTSRRGTMATLEPPRDGMRVPGSAARVETPWRAFCRKPGRMAPEFIQGGGEMGALMRAHDWTTTSLGPPETWPHPLRTTVRLLLNTVHPMYIWWGPELLCFYNDSYRQCIGREHHPGSLGLRRGRSGRGRW